MREHHRAHQRFDISVSNALIVRVRPDLVPWNKVRVVTVTLHYVDAAHGIDKSDRFQFRSGSPEAIWEVFLPDPAHKNYGRSATFFMLDGSMMQRGEEVTTEQIFVLELPA